MLTWRLPTEKKKKKKKKENKLSEFCSSHKLHDIAMVMTNVTECRHFTLYAHFVHFQTFCKRVQGKIYKVHCIYKGCKGKEGAKIIKKKVPF